ncbi:hypothetical protein H4582DRAFT_1947911 [Lactarius indigo]|nr:hypothetical protein H4582DRAFT_1947911 [Lactarius indigo]
MLCFFLGLRGVRTSVRRFRTDDFLAPWEPWSHYHTRGSALSLCLRVATCDWILFAGQTKGQALNTTTADLFLVLKPHVTPELTFLGQPTSINHRRSFILSCLTVSWPVFGHLDFEVDHDRSMLPWCSHPASRLASPCTTCRVAQTLQMGLLQPSI